jgi:cellulase/cellobiase CelA1
MASAQSSEPLPLPAPVVPQPEPDLSESVTVRLRRVAVWDGGSCYVLRVHNRGDDVLESWRVRVRVPKGTAVTSQWGVGIRTSGRGLIMSFPEFSVLSPGERSTGAGLCIDSSRKPRKLRVLA